MKILFWAELLARVLWTGSAVSRPLWQILIQNHPEKQRLPSELSGSHAGACIRHFGKTFPHRSEGYQIEIGEHAYSSHFLPLRGKSSVVETVLLILREIASPLQAEARFEFAMRAALMNWWEWHLENDVVIFHTCANSLLGYNEDELPTTWQEWMDLVHPFDREYVEKNLDECLAGDSDLWYCECRMKTRYGSWIWIDKCGKIIRRNSIGRPIEMMGTIQDIDAKKRAHIDMRAKNDMLEKVGELIKMGTWEYHPDNQEVVWSKETRRILDFSKGFKASAEAFYECVVPEDVEKIKTAFESTVAHGTEYNIKLRCITKKGERITVRTACKTRYDIYGKLVSVSGVFQDITDLEEA